MSSLVITFRDRQQAVIRGPAESVRAFANRIRSAMGGSMDSVISHDLDGEPKDFLCSEVVHFYVRD